MNLNNLIPRTWLLRVAVATSIRLPLQTLHFSGLKFSRRRMKCHVARCKAGNMGDVNSPDPLKDRLGIDRDDAEIELEALLKLYDPRVRAAALKFFKDADCVAHYSDDLEVKELLFRIIEIFPAFRHCKES